jgi:hypothetical protein
MEISSVEAKFMDLFTLPSTIMRFKGMSHTEQLVSSDLKILTKNTLYIALIPPKILLKSLASGTPSIGASGSSSRWPKR